MTRLLRALPCLTLPTCLTRPNWLTRPTCHLRLAERLCLLLLACAALWLPGAAQAQENKVTYEIVGFDAKAETMLVRLDDVNTGLALRLYEVESGQPAKKSVLIPFQRVDGIKTIKDARKKYKITDPGIEDTIYPLDPADETKTLSFFGLMANKERFVLAVTDKKKLGKIKDVPIKVDEETKAMAKASMKTVFWTTDRKTMVAVVSQKLVTDAFSSETDEFHAVRFKPSIIKWVEGEPPPPPEKKEDKEKKEEKKEEKGWWPF